ncbi:IS66 family transposase [Pseudomonas viridiflava]|uniref:IS66 family transposase n=1 Tax=Pseudomonas viridiflava TaxID=33069 RepID=UPI0039B82F14
MRPSRQNWTRFVLPRRQTKPAQSPSARRCRRSSHAPSFVTSQRTRSALAAASFSASAKTSAKSWINFLGTWNGKLVCDDFAGYKASFERGITEIGCMAHARRKFFDLHVANKSQLAEQALHSIGGLYEIERQAKEMNDEDRRRLRQEIAVPVAAKLHKWMLAQREVVPEGLAMAKALDYSLKRWVALTRYLGDGAVPIDNNPVENTIRPWALGRSNWLFAGSLRSGKRAAAIMSLIQSARMNGHDPYAYLKDVLTRLPTQKASEIEHLLPHQWMPD